MRRGVGDEPAGRVLAARIGWMALSLVVSIGMQALSMIYGWGLKPQSWAWIIGAGFFGVLFAKALLLVESERNENGPEQSD